MSKLNSDNSVHSKVHFTGIRNRLFTVISLFLLICTIPDSVHAILGIKIRNVSISAGWNAAWKPADYPEVPLYSEPDYKKAFIVGIRLDIPVNERWRFVPDFNYWSWGRFPKQGNTGTESLLQSYDIKFEFQQLLKRRGKWQPYFGLGVGTHIVRHVTHFPFEFFERSPIVYSEISERLLKFGPSISVGNDYYIIPGMALFQEVRFEFVSGLRQWKFFIGLNTF